MQRRDEPIKQLALLQHWVKSLQTIPELDIIWLEGSLAADRANPGSDIDIRFGIADAAYDQLWEIDRTSLLAGLGEYLLLETTFVRALTAEGAIVEAAAYRTSELNALELYEWKILFSRLPAGEPHFRLLPRRSQPETWPDHEPLTPDLVRALTNRYLWIMAETPAEFYCNEPQSIQFTVDFMRIELVKVMYRRLGMRYGKRLKHLSEVFPPEWLADLARTYRGTESLQANRQGWAQTLMELYQVLGVHVQALGDQAGGGFEPVWYARLYEQVAAELSQFEG